MITAEGSTDARVLRAIVTKEWLGPERALPGRRPGDLRRFLVEDQLAVWRLRGHAVGQTERKGVPLFAIPADRPAPRVFRFKPAEAALAALAQPALERVPQRRSPEVGSVMGVLFWEATLPSRAGPLHLLSAPPQPPPEPPAWALWQVTGDGPSRRLVQLNDPQDLGAAHPDFATDLDDDGRPEIPPISAEPGPMEEVWSASGLRAVDGSLGEPRRIIFCD